MSRWGSRYKIKGGGEIWVLIVRDFCLLSILHILQYVKLNVNAVLIPQAIVAEQDATTCDQALSIQHRLSKHMRVHLAYTGNYCIRYIKQKG